MPPDDRVQAACRPGLEELYRTQGPRLLRLFRRRTSFDHGSDLLQQLFARLAGLSPDQRDRIGNPSQYLHRSAVNLVADHAKASARRSIHLHIAAEDVDLCAPDQMAALEARDMLQRLEVALQRLKPRTREIFLAHRVDGYSYGEIAGLTGLSVKGVEKHMSIAIAFVDRILSSR